MVETRSARQQAIVIVGAGPAAATAAIALRKNGHLGAITVVGEEDHPRTSNRPLSKNFLMGKSAFDKAAVVPA